MSKSPLVVFLALAPLAFSTGCSEVIEICIDLDICVIEGESDASDSGTDTDDSGADTGDSGMDTGDEVVDADGDGVSADLDCADDDALLGALWFYDPIDDTAIGYDGSYFSPLSSGTTASSEAISGGVSAAINGQDNGFRIVNGFITDTPFTIEASLYIDSAECDPRNPYVGFYTNDYYCRLGCSDSDTWLVDDVDSGVAATPQTWTQLTFAYDGAGGGEVFADGVSVGTCALSFDADTPYWLAKHNDDGTITSYVDEFRMCGFE